VTHEADPKPVTVIVSRRPKAGREKDVEQWIEAVGEAVSRWPGYRGVEVFKPRPPDQHDYVVVFRFATEEKLEAWMRSGDDATISTGLNLCSRSQSA
jgi:uncharacterized protein